MFKAGEGLDLFTTRIRNFGYQGILAIQAGKDQMVIAIVFLAQAHDKGRGFYFLLPRQGTVIAQQGLGWSGKAHLAMGLPGLRCLVKHCTSTQGGLGFYIPAVHASSGRFGKKAKEQKLKNE